MIRNPNLLARLFNTPLLILPQKADAIISGLLPRFGLGELEPTRFDAQHPILLPSMAISTPRNSTPEGYSVDGNGIAFIDIGGVLAHRGRIQADSSQILGYDDLGQQFSAAMDDPRVRGIVSTFYSPGGEVAGAFGLAETLAQYRDKKPMLAIVDELAASAAFLLASAHTQIALSPTGYVGSVGVVLRHIDVSAALERDGINVTQIFSGSHKVDGNQFGPLTPEVKTHLQAEVDALRQKFAATVALYRGLSTEDVLATEAAVFTGKTALDQGFADSLKLPDQALADFRQSLISSPLPPNRRATSARHQPRGNSMSHSTDGADLYTQSDLESAQKTAQAAGFQAGTEAERARITGILNHAEAQGRTGMAHVMIETGLNIETAAKLLAASPKEPNVTASAPAQMSAFERHLASIGNPAIGLDVKTGDDEDENSTDALIARAVSLLPANRRPV